MCVRNEQGLGAQERQHGISDPRHPAGAAFIAAKTAFERTKRSEDVEPGSLPKQQRNSFSRRHSRKSYHSLLSGQRIQGFTSPRPRQDREGARETSTAVTFISFSNIFKLKKRVFCLPFLMLL